MTKKKTRDAFTQPDAVVFDPFTGGGMVGKRLAIGNWNEGLQKMVGGCKIGIIEYQKPTGFNIQVRVN